MHNLFNIVLKYKSSTEKAASQVFYLEDDSAKTKLMVRVYLLNLSSYYEIVLVSYELIIKV